MVLYAGQPVDTSESPSERGDGIGSDIYKSGNTMYRATNDKMSIYNLEKKTVYPTEPEPENAEPYQWRRAISFDDEHALKEQMAAFLPSEPVVFWAECTDGKVDSRGVLVGKDLDGGPLYVGRAYLLGFLLPGKVSTYHKVCYVALEGREYAARVYEVLMVMQGSVTWVECKDGYIPHNALPCGFTTRGETVYSAKAKVEGIETPGHFIPGDNVCRISYDMKEFEFKEYEILALEPSGLPEKNT